MGVIRRLSETVANRIAAGEVVERPASILKELVENAIDASAGNIEVRLEGGGLRLLSVRDDGTGMDPEDLALCVQPHATSKISAVEDLFRIASYGFRGEALPSIAAVADLTVTTRRKGDAHASGLRVRYGRVEAMAPAGAPPGTTVSARGLFAELPARLKFLRQERTELAHCVDTLTELLLAEADLGARLFHEDRLLLEVPAGEGRAQRIASLLGEKVAARLLHCRAETGSLTLEAFIGAPDFVKHNTEHQHVFLNGRVIRDRSLAFAIKDAWRGLIMPKEHPVALVFLGMAPSEVDVNVHPRKLEVRFRDRDAVVGFVRSRLRARLDEHAAPRSLRLPDAPAQASEAHPTFELPSVDLSAGRLAEGAPSWAISSAPVARGEAAHPLPRPAASARRREGAGHRCGALRPVARGAGLFAEAGSARFLQAHAAWILLESEEGITILDQHALHERRLYEEILERFRRAAPESQALLIPETVELSATEAARLLAAEGELAGLGLCVEAFGRTGVVVRSVPLALARAPAADLVDEVLSSLDEERLDDRLRLVEKLAANLACRAAVRFGDRLPDEEVRALIHWWRAHPLLRNCPHGRPVAAVLTHADLELQFLRKK